MTLKLKSTRNVLWKRLKLGMVSSFHPHGMCKKVEMVTAKTGCTSCTKRTISIEESGFYMETRLLDRDFIFLDLFELHTLCVFKMHHSKRRHQFPARSDINCCFSVIYRFGQSGKSPWKWKAEQNKLWKGWNLSRYHYFTRIACAKK